MPTLIHALYLSALVYAISTARDLAVSFTGIVLSKLGSIFCLFLYVASSVCQFFVQPLANKLGIGDCVQSLLIGSRQESNKADLMKVAHNISHIANNNACHTHQVIPTAKPRNRSNEVGQQNRSSSAMLAVPDYNVLIKLLADQLLVFLKCMIYSFQEARNELAVSVQAEVTTRNDPHEGEIKRENQTRLSGLQLASEPLTRRPTTRKHRILLSFEYKCEISFDTCDLASQQRQYITMHPHNGLTRIRSVRSEPRLSLLGQVAA